MSRFNIMPRAYRRQLQAADQARVEAITREASDDGKRYANTPGGDARKLRGLPAVSRSVTGAIRGSIPHLDGIRD